MNLKLLVNRQAVYHISRFNGRLFSPCSNHVCRDFSSLTAPSIYDRTAQQNPKFSKHDCSSRRNLYSSPHTSVTESGLAPLSNSSDSTGEDEATNEFLSRFVRLMRGKLTEVCTDYDKKSIDRLLLIVTAKVASAVEKDCLEQMLKASMANPSDDFGAWLLKMISEVSGIVLDDMRKERKKEKTKKFLQCEEVKEMCRFAGEIGIRGDMLRELRFKWAREKMEDTEFYENLKKLKEDGGEEAEVINFETFGEMAITSEEEEKAISLLKRHGKIKYKIYGLDLSDPKWAEVAEKIHEAEDIICPKEAKPVQGKAKLVMEKFFSLKEEDDPSQLLADWEEILQPSRVDWMNLLDELKRRNRSIFCKVSEHLLNEKPFPLSVGNYSMLIDAYAKENRIEDAERILKKMNEDGISPDHLTVSVLVQMYCKAGNLQRAKEAFETFESLGFRPDIKLYTSMILAYVNAGEAKLAEALMWKMESKNVKPTEEIYKALLRAFSQLGDGKGAERIVKTMDFARVQPSLEAYSYLVEAHGRDGDPNKARSHFDYIRKSGHKPDDKITASMIAAYEKKNLLDKALELLLELEKGGFEPGPATYTVLVDWFGKLGLVEEVEEILGKISQQGESPPFEIQVSLCDMYARAGNEKKALQALGAIESKKEHLNLGDFVRVIHGLLAGGFAQDARRIRELMEAQGFTSAKVPHKQLEQLNVALASSRFIGKTPKVN